MRPWFALVLVAAGCEPAKETVPPPIDSADGSGEAGEGTDTENCPAGGCVACELPHEPCEEDNNDPLKAFGLTCADRLLTVENVQFTGPPAAFATVPKIGKGNKYAPTEGDSFAVMGTGQVDELLNGTFCDFWWVEEYYQGEMLPDPIQIPAVSQTSTCLDDPALVGTGDCSNTIESQFLQGQFAHDYSEIRFTDDVPMDATAVKFDFAFLSTEYPEYYGLEFNDMFVAWLESENWTGNVSFDESGNPISLNASFLHYRDDNSDLPQLEGTCMAGHAGTRWLTTQAAVTPGEAITMVFGIFDLGDGQLDSFVLLDNFRWGCDDDDDGPSTNPGTTTSG